MNAFTREIATRYLEGKCSPEEVLNVEQLLKDPANLQILEEVMSEHWDEVGDQAEESPRLNHVLENIHTYIVAAPEGERGGEGISKSRRLEGEHSRWFYVSRVAAAIAFAVVATLGIYYLLPATSQQSTAEAVVRTAQDEVTKVTLPDSTIVWLNAKSTIKYNSRFDGATRDVYLDGEGYFDVAHNPAKPFIVHAKDLDVKVLGTVFNVKSYAGDGAVETTLIQGKIVIENFGDDQSPVELMPNERAMYSKDTREIKLSTVNDPRVYTTWIESVLIFEDETVGKFIQAVEKRYGVEIHIPQGQRTDCKMTGRIRDETLEEVLDLLKSTTSINYTIVNKEVYIEGVMCD